MAIVTQNRGGYHICWPIIATNCGQERDHFIGM